MCHSVQFTRQYHKCSLYFKCLKILTINIIAESLSEPHANESVVLALCSRKCTCICTFTTTFKNTNLYKCSHHTMNNRWIYWCSMHIRLVHMFITQRITRVVYRYLQHMTIHCDDREECLKKERHRLKCSYTYG